MSNVVDKSFVALQTSVSTSAVKVATIPANVSQILAVASAACFIGGSNVATSGANIGFPLSTTPITVPSSGTGVHDLYAIAASGVTVTVLVPQ